MMPQSASLQLFKVKRPDGRIYAVPENNLDQAISLGGEVIDQNEGGPEQSPLSQQKMFKVRRPDGKIYEIPQSNLQKAQQLGGEIIDENPVSQSQQQPDSFGRQIARSAKSLASGAVGGLIDTATSLYNIPASIENATTQIMQQQNPDYMGENDFIPASQKQPLPLIPSAEHAIDTTIDEATGGYTKNLPGSESTQAGLRMIGAIGSPGGLAKGVSKVGKEGVAKVLNTLGTTKVSGLAGAGAAGYAASEASQGGYGPLASIGAGLTAGGAVGGATNAIKSFNTKVALAKLTGNSPKNIDLDALRSAEASGIDYANTLINKSKGLAVAEQVLLKSPHFGTKYSKKLEGIDKQYAEKVDEAIGKVGQKLVQSNDALDTGVMLQQTMEDVKNEVISEKNKLYNISDDFLPESAARVPRHLIKALNEEKKSINTLSPSDPEREVLGYISNVENKLFAPPKSEEVSPIISPNMTNASHLDDIVRLNTDPSILAAQNKSKPSIIPEKMAVLIPVKRLVGSKVSINEIIDWDPKIIGAARDRLKKIQYSYKQDLAEYGQSNPKWYEAFNKAENFYGHYLGDNALGSNTLKKVLTDKNPEKIIPNLRDISDFRNIRQSLGHSAEGREFFDSIRREKLNDLLTGKVIDPKSGNVSYLPFSKVIENPSTRQLVKYLAGSNYKDIIQFKKYAEAIYRKNQRNPNPSGTASTKTILSTLIGALGGGGAVLNGLPGVAEGLGIAYAGGSVLSWFLNNKKALGWGIEAAKKQAAGDTKAANIFGNRIEKSITQDLGEDFVKQFIALTKNDQPFSEN